MFRDYFLLALKNLRKRGIRSYLTMLGIFLGIAAVVALISLGSGLQGAITGQFSTLSPDRLIITSAETGFGPPGATAVRKLTEHDLKLIESVPEVKIAIPRIIRIAEVKFNKISKFKFIGSIPEEQDETDSIYQTFSIEAQQGKLLESEDRNKVILGSDFAENNEFEKQIRIGTILEIQGRNFEVIGILKKTGTFQFNSAIFMPEEDMKEILDIGDEIDLIAVQVTNVDFTDIAAEEITRKLRKDRDQKSGEEDFSVETPVQSLEAINTVLGIINIVVSGIAAVSLLIGGIGIANTMFTSVLERTKEIGIMKAIGAGRKDILSIFIIEAALLGLIGGIIGALIGLGLAFTASKAAGSILGGISLQVTFSLPLIIAAISFSLLVGIISGVLPALQASRLHPVEALRK